MTRRAFGGIRRLPSKHWQASYTGPDGRRHLAHSTYLVKADAEHWLREEELLIDQGTWTPPSRRLPIDLVTPMTLGEYAAANIRRRATRSRKPLRPSTVDNYTKLLNLAILPGLGHLPLVDITPLHITRWHDGLPERTPMQNGNAYALLRSILADAEDEDLIDRNPARVKGGGKPAPKRTGQALTIGELTVYAYHVRAAHLLPLLVAAWCGLRSGEVRGLRRCDVSTDGTRIHVAQTVTRIGKAPNRRWHIGPPKTAAGVRTVAVPPHLTDALADYVATWDTRHKDATGFLWPAGDGSSPLNDSVLREAHKAGAEAIGRPDLTLHDLRRTGATLAAQAGATVKEVMRMLGHTQPGVAMLYQVADDQRDVDRAARMSALLP